MGTVEMLSPDLAELIHEPTSVHRVGQHYCLTNEGEGELNRAGLAIGLCMHLVHLTIWILFLFYFFRIPFRSADRSDHRRGSGCG